MKDVDANAAKVKKANKKRNRVVAKRLQEGVSVKKYKRPFGKLDKSKRWISLAAELRLQIKKGERYGVE